MPLLLTGARGYSDKFGFALSRLSFCMRADVADVLWEDPEAGVTWFPGTMVYSENPRGLG